MRTDGHEERAASVHPRRRDGGEEKPSTQASAWWGSDAMAATLRALDIPFIALVPGASYRGLHDSLVNFLGNARPQLLVCLHEEHTVAIAHGYYRVCERMMAAGLHANVGLMHAAMSIFNAWCDRVPVLVLGATGPVDAVKRRPWIDWIHTARDQGALVRDYTKWDDQPASAGAAQESLLRAALLANTAPCGPVYVCLDAASRSRGSTRCRRCRKSGVLRRRRQRSRRESSSAMRRSCSARRKRPASSPGASAEAKRRGRPGSRSPRTWAPACSRA